MTAYGASLLLVSGTEELKERWESHGNESKMFFTFLVGTAGAGKSLLTASLEKWLLASEMSVAIVNLDPGVEEPPYTSDVDIREYVDYGEIMHQFGLGPNGALVASLDMAVSHVNDLREEILDTGRDYALVDCPGQMELFAYRNSGPMLVSSLSGRDPTISLNIRFGLPQLNVLSKPDILTKEQMEQVVEWAEEPHTLDDALNKSASGLVREYSASILRMMEDLGGVASLVPVSAKEMTGIDILYGELQRVFAGGEDYVTYE
jgi:GTPase SAR1 family protein